MRLSRIRRPAVSAAVSLALTVGAATGTVLGAGTASAAGCADVQVVSARGTDEPDGWLGGRNLGALVGNPVYTVLDAVLPGPTDAYRVNYPASRKQPASVQAGNRDLVDHVVRQAQACPHQRFVLVGYSQGANVVANALGVSSEGARVGGPITATLPAHLQPRITAVLLFGNPIRGIGKTITGPYADRTYDVCNTNDPVCDPGGTDWNVHLHYGWYAVAAAQFVAGRL
ncbi:cutinase family protein [Nocardia mangyaensis]|uniref:cutinase family protein n=1 Tax=Nocardia mangyaensis TaxID=2213200 RepID=UPI002675E9D1|nr:cutinase family protein [Nocardia mangyaensis]MDO3649860.1 cutinase family protein [Nocardia mangyaensis]